ncbi:hypothetical protein BDN70DRAFT_876489 [Pholiota conissans]|uniref:Uncharacterized protein n=1 Tax=Pholiota conissans TaxID=109636 RepID=A0A9P6D2D9_9AGAR|nr:hypothetical protein BDN70DRAFT_876489 [Pholiota conissans]
MSITGDGSPVAVSGTESTSSSDHAKTVVLNLAYPSRITCDAPWACPTKPIVFKPTVCTRYEAPFVYSDGVSGLVWHQGTASVGGGGVFDHDALRWLKQVFSRNLRKLRRKIRLVKANLAIVALVRRNT